MSARETWRLTARSLDGRIVAVMTRLEKLEADRLAAGWIARPAVGAVSVLPEVQWPRLAEIGGNR